MGNLKKPDHILAVIGARSGSKSVPDKNIRPLGGKPLIAWIIETSLNSTLIDKTVVSTDSEQYACIAKTHGAEAPFLRSDEMSSDSASETVYVKHAVEWLIKNEGYKPGIVVRLQPTNPLQIPEDVDECVRLLLNNPEFDSAMVVAEARQHPNRALKLVSHQDGSQRLFSFITGNTKDAAPHNRQSHEKAYFRANIVATRTDMLLKRNSQVGDKILCHVIPQERALDIDSPMDFLVAEQLIKKYRVNQ